MSMSRKDYEAVAAIFRDERTAAEREYAPGLSGEQAKATCVHTINRLEEALCTLYKQDNPRFDPARFRKAAQP